MEYDIFMSCTSCCFHRKFVVTLGKFKYLYFKFWFVVKGGLIVRDVPMIHNIYGLSRVGTCILVGSMCMLRTKRVWYYLVFGLATCPVLIKVKQHIVGCASDVFANAHNALLC